MAMAAGGESGTEPGMARAFPGRGAPKATMAERLAHLALGAACVAVLLIGLRVEPAAAGHGSHTQIGLPPCGWAVAFGKPCATCGMTTAVSLVVRGELPRAFVTQPAGFAFAVVCAMLFWMSLHVTVTGSALGRLVGREVFRPRILWGLGSLVLGSWAYKFLTW